MIVLDTNVLSEPMRPVPDPRVMDWFDAQDGQDLWITAIVAAELWAGVAKLSVGSRRNGLQEQVEATLHEFDGRILAFDEDAAFVYGALVGPLLAKRMPYEVLDYQIAAITLVNGGTLATRNIKHFADTGVPLFNPWEA
ncbi:MAG: hypothetical protein JWQ89_265 [Devosia sp.]|uniref:type II toxin-antitoxin system VapC family toxin n=1 Tax=Devosia sp. TaxID=1871048 RepID=UPI0026375362|nr:type II toxin-antitoxin system VapC family toxin [Devosia sp.]MDB5538538.1 hypothetical protein [Devosia sp.]